MISITKRLMTYGLMFLLAFGLGCSDGDGDGAGVGKGDGSGGGDGKKPTVAFVTNGIADFWKIGESGAIVAANEVGVNLEVRMPPDGAVDQKRMLEELLARQIDGAAISPIDPDNQQDLLNEVADNTIYITHDSDAPDSKRLCYIGMDNYDAGRACGKLVKEAIPDGGEVIIFVGRIEQLNAKLRRQGLIDELMDRSHDNTRFDKPGDVTKGDKYVILDTRTDQFDRSKAKAEVQDAISKYPNLKCMVGLFEYNPPIMLEVVRDAGKLDDIKIVAFDENWDTLKAIETGECVGTIVQNPYEYGYQSVKMLAQLVAGDKSSIPENQFVNIPYRVIKKDNVEAFSKELKDLLAKADEIKQQGQK